jgi:hypothetical protein
MTLMTFDGSDASDASDGICQSNHVTLPVFETAVAM